MVITVFTVQKRNPFVIPKSVKKIGKKALEASDLEKIRLKKETKFMQKMVPVFIRRKPKNLL